MDTLSSKMGNLVAFIVTILCTGQLTHAQSDSKVPENIATSSYTIQRWSAYNLAGNLQKFIDHEELRLKVINNFTGYEDEVPFVKRRLEEFKIIHKDLLKNATDNKKFQKSLKGNHPTTVFAALRNFVYTWEDKFDNTTIYGARLREFMEANNSRPLPTRKDLDLVGRSITVVQASYNISMDDLLKGQVMGQQGEPLSSADCYDIGKAVLEAGLLDTAREWIEAAMKSVDLEKADHDKFTFNVSDGLASLAKIAYKKKDQNKALELFEKAVELDPENMAVYQDYVKHRFGRDVDPIDELDRETVEPWRKKFFDLCKNSTNATWLQQQQKQLTLNSKLKCRLRASKLVPYRRYKEEVVSKSPYISLVYDFVVDKEVERLRNVTLPELTETVLPGNKANLLWHFKAGWFKDDRSEVLEQISHRVGDVTGLNVSQGNGLYSLGEPIHVIDYGISGLALPHGDFAKTYSPRYMRIPAGKRFVTAQVYLSDATWGGATVFIEQNVTVIPVKGMAVLWYNFKPSGEPESTLFAATCPLAVGENIVLEKGVWRYPNDEASYCGRKPRSSHLTLTSVSSTFTCARGNCTTSDAE